VSDGALEDGKVAGMRFVADEADAKGINRRYCEFPDRPGIVFAQRGINRRAW
jgi:hypothetical protein